MQTETQPETQRMNIAVPFDLYERVREEGFKRRVSYGQVVAEILAPHYAQKDREKRVSDSSNQ